MQDFEYPPKTECGTTNGGWTNFNVTGWPAHPVTSTSFPVFLDKNVRYDPLHSIWSNTINHSNPFHCNFLHLRSLLWCLLFKPCHWVLTVKGFSLLSISGILLSNFLNKFIKVLFGVDDTSFVFSTVFFSLSLPAAAALVPALITNSDELVYEQLIL